jgi:hypothetical protein
MNPDEGEYEVTMRPNPRFAPTDAHVNPITHQTAALTIDQVAMGCEVIVLPGPLSFVRAFIHRK